MTWLYHRILDTEEKSLETLISIFKTQYLLPSNRLNIESSGNPKYIYLSPNIPQIDPCIHYSVTLIFDDSILLEEISYWNIVWKGDIVVTTKMFNPSEYPSYKKSEKYKEFYDEFVQEVINQKRLNNDLYSDLVYGEIILANPLSINHLRKVKMMFPTDMSPEVKSLFQYFFKLLRKTKKVAVDIELTYI